VLVKIKKNRKEKEKRKRVESEEGRERYSKKLENIISK